MDKKHKNDGNEVNNSQMVMKVVPDTLFDLDAMDLDVEDLLAATLMEDPDGGETLNTVEEAEVEVALGSGCVKHCYGKEDLPRDVRERIRPPPPNTKDFIGAGGHGIKRHGSVMRPTIRDGFGPVNQWCNRRTSRGPYVPCVKLLTRTKRSSTPRAKPLSSQEELLTSTCSNASALRSTSETVDCTSAR